MEKIVETMIAGRMKDRLRILRPVSTEDVAGGRKTSYEETATAWAERRKVSPSFVMELGELFSDMTVEFNIRDTHRIEEKWRVQHIGGHLYTVANIIPNRDRGMLTLRCERVNT